MSGTINIVINIAVAVAVYITLNLLFDKFILKKRNSINLKFLKSIVQVLIIALSLYFILSQFTNTKDFGTKLMQGSTLIVAILTFAAQKTLGNIISGFSIALARPFDVGQKIRVMNGNNILAEGYIKDITVRHTVIQQYDGQSCIIPNSVMDESVIVNTNYEGDIGNFIEIEISFKSDIQKAKKIFKEIIKEQLLCINKDNVNIYVSRFTPNGCILKTTIWTKTLDDNFLACSVIRERLIREYNDNDIEIPYQNITIHHI